MILFKEIAEGILEPVIQPDRYLSKGEIGFIELPASLKGPCYTCPSPKNDLSYYGVFPKNVTLCATYHSKDTPPFEYTTATYTFMPKDDRNNLFSIAPFVKSFEHLSTYLQTVIGWNQDASIISLTIHDSNSPIDPFIPLSVCAKTSENIERILKGANLNVVTEKMFRKFDKKEYTIKNGEMISLSDISGTELALGELHMVLVNIIGTGICYAIPGEIYEDLINIRTVTLRVFGDSLVGERPLFTIEAQNLYEILEMCYCVPDILYLERRFYGRNLSYRLDIETRYCDVANEFHIEKSYLEEQMDGCNFYDIITEAVK